MLFNHHHALIAVLLCNGFVHAANHSTAPMPPAAAASAARSPLATPQPMRSGEFSAMICIALQRQPNTIPSALFLKKIRDLANKPFAPTDNDIFWSTPH